jgi:O-antigen ligase
MRELTSTSAHNGYLGVILDYGFIGLGLVLLFILSCARKAVKSMASDLDWGIFFICFILMLLVHNIAESSIQTFTYTLTAITLFLSVTSSKDIQKKRLSHETIKGLKPE